MKKLWSIAIGAAMVVGSSISQAMPIIYFGENLSPGGVVSGEPVTARDSFLSGLTGVGSEDFESFADAAGTPLDLTFPGSTGSITATLTGTGFVYGAGSICCGRFATSGQKIFDSSGAFSIAFSDPVSAFGFYGTDIGDVDGQVTLSLMGGNAGVVNLTIPNTINAPNGSLLFYGFIDAGNSYTSIAFGNTAAGSDYFGFDDMVIGDRGQIVPPSSVPVPATLALLGLGLVGLGWSRRNKA